MAARAASDFEGLSKEELVQVVITTKQQASPFNSFTMSAESAVVQPVLLQHRQQEG